MIGREPARAHAAKQVGFLCECGDSRCSERVQLTPDEYEQQRGPLLAPAHALASGRCPDCGGYSRWYREADSVFGLVAAEPAAIAQTRAKLAQALLAAGADGACRAEALLLLSEVMSNAVRHGSREGDEIELLWTIGRGCLHVAVRDRARGVGVPVVLAAEAEREEGRGLRILDRLANSWSERIIGGRREVAFTLLLFASSSA